ncbi:MAG TPA: AraC family transcriptional regulator [Thermoanaerobaculia bacterium]|nr:AraC family transcriptional regulator [Thermoanaerobaculia bacterium]
MTEATVVASFVRGLMDFAVSKGANRKELADRARIDPAELQDPDGRIPFGKYVALMRAAKELCNDPALALHFGEAVDMSEMTIVGMTGNPSGTMEDGIAQLNRFAPLVLDVNGGGDRYQLERIDGQLWMVDGRPNPNASPEVTESAFARAVCGMRRRFGDAEFVEELHFTHPEPAYREEYDRIFQVPVVFDCEKNAVRLSDRLWPVARAALPPRSVSEVLSAHAEALLEKLESSKTTRGRIESLLIPILHTGDASMDVVAGKLGLSRQTLFRRLRTEGVTFEKVLDELRHEMALHYLNEKKLSVNETAYLVGFSDPAAFSRAFKRWTGSSPGTMRASKSGKDQPRAS